MALHANKMVLYFYVKMPVATVQNLQRIITPNDFIILSVNRIVHRMLYVIAFGMNARRCENNIQRME